MSDGSPLQSTRVSYPRNAGLTSVTPYLGPKGWPFASVHPVPGADVDPLYNCEYIKDLYFKANPEFSSRCVA